MSLSRQQIVRILRRARLEDDAADALATLPDQVPTEQGEEFCIAHGLSTGSLMDRMGSSP
jgi:hypothetical protein